MSSSLPPQIAETVNLFADIQIHLLNKQTVIEQNLREIFMQCVELQSQKDTRKALASANSCVHERRQAQMIETSQTTIEETLLKLKSMSNAESLASQLPTIITTVKGLQNRLSQLAPESSPLLLQIEQLLQEVLDQLTGVQDESVRTRLSRFFQRSDNPS